MSEVGLIAPLGGLVLVALFYMRRVSEGDAATAWGGAWLVLYLTGVVASVPDAPRLLLAANHVLGSLFPALLFAGAWVYCHGGPMPRAPVVAGLAIGCVRMGLALAGHRGAALALAAPVELPFTVGAAALAWRVARERPSLPAQLLPPALAVMALVNCADPLARSFDLPMVPVVVGWISTVFTVAMLQIAAFVERGRERERHLLLERDVLHRVARAATQARDREAALASAIAAVSNAGWFDAFGIWLLEPDGTHFRCAARLDPTTPLPPAFRRFPMSMPLLREPLARDEPSRIAADLGAGRSRFADTGLGEVMAVPLRVHGRTLGLLIAGLVPERRFGEDGVQMLASLANELALVLAHVDAVDASERQARALAGERQRLLALVEAVPLGILLVDRDDRVTTFSRIAAEHLGLDEASGWIGRQPTEMVPLYAHRLTRPAAHRLARAFDRAETAGFDGLELQFEKPVPRTVVLHAREVLSEDGELMGRVFVSRDVTAERAVAERLQRAQRMEMLGTLAGGVAHDFNNQLTAILGNARRAADRLGADAARPDPDAAAALAEIEDAAEHCAELTRGLLDLARQTPIAPQPVALLRAVHDVEALLRPMLPPDVVLRVAAPPDLRALADPGQLRRVLTNLALNARDAVGTRGEIAIVASAAVDGDDRVEIAVSDTGSGIDPDTLERIFDPFFTTKPDGEGTGLGLAIVQRIVESHDAAIEVRSAPGSGTTFRLLWPAAVGAAGSYAAARVAYAERKGTAGRAAQPADAAAPATVLLAEDDPAVRRLARAALERAGYRVHAACDGEEALALFDRHADAIDAVVADLEMPRRSGPEVLAAVRERAPTLPVVLTTGHGPTDLTLPGPPLLVLEKPFRPDALAAAVADALGGEATERGGAGEAKPAPTA